MGMKSLVNLYISGLRNTGVAHKAVVASAPAVAGLQAPAGRGLRTPFRTCEKIRRLSTDSIWPDWEPGRCLRDRPA
jgi:hypothetical protein